MCWGWLESRRWRRLTDGTVLTRWRGLRRFTTWLLAEANLPGDAAQLDRRLAPWRRRWVGAGLCCDSSG
jgi:hypothetical protein